MPVSDIVQITNQNHWFIDEFGTTRGNRTKFVAINADVDQQPIAGVQRWFWKESLARYPIEFWSEILAYRVGAAIGVPVPPCVPSTYQGRYGALAQNMVDVSEQQVLFQGGVHWSHSDQGFQAVIGPTSLRS
ncbi:MAG TPA: hypothetical protein VG944_24270 [Fimbriimonas sp.]|nr:hypothetical protein [Fimbriimonas sp.]